MFVGALNDIKFIPPSHLLHDAHYIYYILPYVPLIDPGYEAVVVQLFFHVHLHYPSAGFPPLVSLYTHNIASRVSFYSVEFLYHLFFVAPLAHMAQ